MGALKGFFAGHWQLMALLVVIFALWQTPVVYPLKLLVIFLHEFAHGLAAILTGGDIVQLNVSPREGGFALTRGGSRFIILMSGYLGSLVLGMALLFGALRTNADRLILAVMGTLMLLVAALYMRDAFTLAFSLLVGAAMLAAAKYLSLEVADMILRVIGLTSMIYVPYDIFNDTIQRAHLQSDAWMLADEFGGTTRLWGGAWLVISVIMIAAACRYGLGRDSNLHFRRLRG